ncbi:MAG: glycosyltransferase family 2 protein [Candidatus Binatia bacterium]
MSGGSCEISIVLLTFNGEQYLAEVLASIFTQRTRLSYEVLAIDSGSTDRTLEILNQHPVRVIKIPNLEFGHGRTRNLAAQNSLGRYVVFLTQDAEPANEHWLETLVRPLVEDERVAGSYSRQVPRPDCNPIESRDIGIGAGPLSTVKRVDQQDPFQKQNYAACLFRFIAFSNVSSCIRRDALARLPFSEKIVMMEDQEWCKRAIESGYWIIYEATSVVHHSHNHPLPMIYQRHFDYGLSLREFASLPLSLKGVLSYAVFEAMGDVIFIVGRREGALSTWKWILKAPIIRFVMRYGLYRGLHSRTRPPVVVTNEVAFRPTESKVR